MLKILRRFLTKKDGAVAILAAIVLPVSLGLVAATVDYSSAFYSKSKTQDALDSASLAYLQDYLLHGNERQAMNVAMEVFRSNSSDGEWNVDLGRIREVNGHLQVDARAHARIEPILLNAIGVQHVDLAVKSETRVAIRAISAVLVPDVSWSMRGTPINAVKEAMVAFGNAMYSLPRQFRNQLHVAAAPYAGTVNVSALNANVRNQLRGWEFAPEQSRDFDERQHYLNANGCNASNLQRVQENLRFDGNRAVFDAQRWTWQQVAIVEQETYWDRDDENNPLERTRDRTRYEWQCVDEGIVRTRNWDGCLQTASWEFDPSVVRRAGDVPPLPPTLKFPQRYPHCPPGRSAARSSFHSHGDYTQFVRGMELGWATAHDTGLLWGARFLEPAWAPTLQTPNRPWNNEDFPKYLVFMSDGKAATIGYRFGEYSWRDQGQINRNSVNICNYLKARGVTIFGISYASGRSDVADIRTPRDCASDGRHYVARTHDVGAVFEDIAVQIISENLRITR